MIKSIPLFQAEHLAFLNEKLHNLSPEKIIEWAIVSLPNLYQTTAFGLSGLVITDIINKHYTNTNQKHSTDLIFIDTLHHFDETLHLINRVKNHYNLNIHVYKPEAVETREEFTTKYGESLWVHNESKYDYITKVEPAYRANQELKVKALFTGRRKSQNGSRSRLNILEIDSTGILKVNPLANWTFHQVEAYIKANNVPYNTLLDKGYLSIGDYHSTIPSNDKNDERSGRWANKTKTECGLHKDYFKLKLAATSS